MYILTWNGSDAKVMINNVVYTSYEKPNLSFDFVALFYEEPTSTSVYVDNASNQRMLTEDQKNEIIQWCINFVKRHDYLVCVVNEDRIFERMMYRKEAEAQGKTFILLNEPPANGLYRLTFDNTWEKIVVAFLETGEAVYSPTRGKPYVLFMNDVEFTSLGERPSLAHVLDFKTMKWVDNRSLDRVKFHAKSDVMGYFQYYRSHNIEGRVSSFEYSTWSIQKNEAEAWLKNNNAKTPFIDGMLSELKNHKISKQELCQRIVNHYTDEELTELGKLHGKMYSYIYDIQNAATITQVDNIIEKLTEFTGGRVVLNITSGFKPAFKAYGKDFIAMEDSSDNLYHAKLG